MPVLRPERRRPDGRACGSRPVVVTIDGTQERSRLHPAPCRGPRRGRAGDRARGGAAARAKGYGLQEAAVASRQQGPQFRPAGRHRVDAQGCGLKAIRRDVYLALPYFDALHRFMPALVRREGYEVALVDVVDRPRLTGVSNYGFFDRLWSAFSISPASGGSSAVAAAYRRDGDPLQCSRPLPRPRRLPVRRVRGALRLLAGLRHRGAAAVHRPLHRAVDREREGGAQRHADGLLGCSPSAAA